MQHNESLHSKPFTQQLDDFLAIPKNTEMFAKDIARDEDGTIRTSRVRLYMDGVSQTGTIASMINAFEKQQRVSASQPVNKGRSEWAFFCYSDVRHADACSVSSTLIVVQVSHLVVSVLDLFFRSLMYGRFTVLPFPSSF